LSTWDSSCTQPAVFYLAICLFALCDVITANLYFKHPVAIVYKVKELNISHNKIFYFQQSSGNYQYKVFLY